VVFKRETPQFIWSCHVNKHSFDDTIHCRHPPLINFRWARGPATECWLSICECQHLPLKIARHLYLVHPSLICIVILIPIILIYFLLLCLLLLVFIFANSPLACYASYSLGDGLSHLLNFDMKIYFITILILK